VSKVVAVLNPLVARFVEGRLPDWLDVRWFHSPKELLALAPEAEIAWLDGSASPATHEAVRLATGLRWLNTLAAGVDPFPLDLLRARGVVLTNGAGLNAITIAEYAVMGMLVIAKGYREVVRAQDRHAWLTEAPGSLELAGTRALVIGAGGIGGRSGAPRRPPGAGGGGGRRPPPPRAPPRRGQGARRRRRGRAGLPPPAPPPPHPPIGAAELAAMKPSAALLNFARGAVIDQAALVTALRDKAIAAAFLDVTDPEPLPAGHPLWSLDNCHITMHLSGRSQQKLVPRSAERFLANLERYGRGEALEYRVDLALGY